MKRVFDGVLAAVGIALLWPLFLVVAVLIRLDSPGPVFFRQERVGRHGRHFRIWKFRTMAVDAEAKGLSITVMGDRRITRVGRSLRKHKIDELPQLLNVLRGEMSFVGPRPEVPRYVELYTPAQRNVLELKPGITDPASIRYRNEAELLASAADAEAVYVREVMPEKIRINLAYGERANLWSDAAVIIRTLVHIPPAPSLRADPRS